MNLWLAALILELSKQQKQKDTQTMATLASAQFPIAQHYDMMEQLDQDVHDNAELSASEVKTAIRLLGFVPESVFLPCFGTGRHIPWFKQFGVRRIVGVDLSPKCVAKAQKFCGHLPDIELITADVALWQTTEKFQAAIVLGNSFADCVDKPMLQKVTYGMVKPIIAGGKFLMDYIGTNYLDHCASSQTTCWDASINNIPVKDFRTPSYDSQSHIMTVSVRAESLAENNKTLWQGYYQKLILSEQEVIHYFSPFGLQIFKLGIATTINADYYRTHFGNLGMIAKSDWWLGNKR